MTLLITPKVTSSFCKTILQLSSKGDSSFASHLQLLHISPYRLIRAIGFKTIGAVKTVLLDGANTSFEASLVMYMNTSILPTVIIGLNRMYENQNLLYIVPLSEHTNTDCWGREVAQLFEALCYQPKGRGFDS